jgi:WD domain, G-beta repeat
VSELEKKQAAPEPRGDVQSDSDVHTFANAGAGTASAADKATAVSERPKSWGSAEQRMCVRATRVCRLTAACGFAAVSAIDRLSERREWSTRWHNVLPKRSGFASAMADMDEALMRALSALDPANAAAAPATEAEAEEEEAEAEVEQEGDGAEVNAAEYQLQLDAGGDVPQLQVDAVPEAGEEAEAAAAAGAQEEQLGEDGAGVGGGEEVQPTGAVGGDGDAGDAENGEDSAAMDAARKQQMRCEPVAPPVPTLSPKPHILFLNAPHTAPSSRAFAHRSTTCSSALMGMLASESPLCGIDSGLSRVTRLFSSTLSYLAADDAKAEALSAVEAASGDADDGDQAPGSGGGRRRRGRHSGGGEEAEEAGLLPPGVQGLLGMVAALGPVRVLSGSADRTLRVWEPSRLADGQDAVTIVLEGHSNWVHAVCDLGDNRCVSASDDCTLRIWHIPSGKCENILRGHTGYVTCVVPLANERLLSGSDDSTLRIWSLSADGECEAVLQGHSGDVTCCCDCGGGLVVSGSRDKMLRVWRLVDGETQAKLRGHNNTVYAVTTITPTPQGAPRVASGSADGLVCIWNCAAGTCDRVLEGSRCTLYAICCLDDVFGSIVAAGSDGVLRCWRPDDDQTPPVVMPGHADSVLSLAPLPGGRCVSGSQDSTLRVWHPAAPACEAVLKGHTNWVLAASALHPAPVKQARGSSRRMDDTDDDDD